MKIVFLSFSIFLTAIFSDIPQLNIQPIASHEKDTPSYAKWGLLAMKETKARYTDAQIIDYLHKGREVKEQETIEHFKLWLRGKDREFGVFVNITFDTITEKVINITFTETDH